MKSSHPVAGAAAALLCGFAPVAAQSVNPAPELSASQEIVVEAPRELPPSGERSDFSGAPVVTTTVRITALYGDLDLTRSENAARLMTRIESAARDACAYLDRLYPLNPDPACFGGAVTRAAPAAKAIIAAAGR